jgi:hypothetical protein
MLHEDELHANKFVIMPICSKNAYIECCRDVQRMGNSDMKDATGLVEPHRALGEGISTNLVDTGPNSLAIREG